MDSIPPNGTEHGPSAIERACEAVGGQARLAELVKVTPQAVYLWVKNNKVPVERVLSIEAAVEGAVKRHELRPDIYPEEAAA